MPTVTDVPASEAAGVFAAAPVEPPASADAQATAEAARLAAVRHAQVLSAMQTAQDAVVAAVRGMTRPPAGDA